MIFMKKMNLGSIELEMLKEKESKNLVGGNSCGCGCAYANSGGSSMDANGNANYAGNKWSPGGVREAIVDVIAQP